MASPPSAVVSPVPEPTVTPVTPSSHKPPSPSPPSSAKAVPAEMPQPDAMKEEDKQLLHKALLKIEELENRLKTTNGKPDETAKEPEDQEEDDEDPIITPDGQKNSCLISIMCSIYFDIQLPC